MKRILIALCVAVPLALALPGVAAAKDIRFDGQCNGLSFVNLLTGVNGDAIVVGHETGCVAGAVSGLKTKNQLTGFRRWHIALGSGPFHAVIRDDFTFTYYDNATGVPAQNGTWSPGVPDTAGSEAPSSLESPLE